MEDNNSYTFWDIILIINMIVSGMTTILLVLNFIKEFA